MTISASHLLSHTKILVIKLGSSLLIDTDRGTPKLDWLTSFIDDVLTLHKAGVQMAIVSSGAIALGRSSVGIDLKTPSKDIALDLKQAAASVGQIHLAHLFQSMFAERGVIASQILLRPDDTEDRLSHLNARATFNALLSRRIIPIINENDTTATEEIQFGGNDPLAARVAQMIEADTLLILSTTNGLYTDDPRVNKNAEHIPFVEHIDQEILALAKDPIRGISTGGMKSKIESSRIAVNAGAHVIIANGLDPNPISDLKGHTIILAHEKPRAARKRWILAHVNTNAHIVIDDGAVKALKTGKSLLPVGMVSVHGEFKSGDAIKIFDQVGHLHGVGLSHYNHTDCSRLIKAQSADIPLILGFEGRDEIIHRDNLALME